MSTEFLLAYTFVVFVGSALFTMAAWETVFLRFFRVTSEGIEGNIPKFVGLWEGTMISLVVIVVLMITILFVDVLLK